MDSLTHIVLGAVVGEIAGRGKMGKRAMVLGAAAQSLPDIDFLAFLWTTPSEDLLVHRGFTHSILFIILISPFLALIAKRYLRDVQFTLSNWLIFFGIELAIHDFLDAFNTYGTGWLEPFSHVRVSFQTLFVADPFFSVIPAVACIALFVLKAKSIKRRQWAWAGTIGCALYLGYAISNKISIDNKVAADLQTRSITYDRYLSTPTPLNTWLWWVVAETNQGFHVGFRSVFDTDTPMEFHFFPRNDSLLNKVDDMEEVMRLKRFSDGYYTVVQRQDTLVFNDLRFGQNGWDNPRANFVFNFYLSHPAENRIVIQRGRFSHWNKRTIQSFIQRIFGR